MIARVQSPDRRAVGLCNHNTVGMWDELISFSATARQLVLNSLKLMLWGTLILKN